MNLASSFDEIYRKNWKQLYFTAYKILKDKELSEDVVQEVFSSLWNRRHVAYPDPVEPYLYKALKFQVFKTLRNAKIKERVWNNIEKASGSISLSQNLEIKELQEFIGNSIDSLPEKCRIIYKLRREEELSIKEISHELSISPKTVEGQLTIAFRKLKDSLAHFIF